MRRSLYWLTVLVVVVLLSPTTLPGQLPPHPGHPGLAAPYDLTLFSHYESGCTGPSTCLCPVFIAGPLAGSLEFQALLPPLGPIFEYSVVNLVFSTISDTGEDIAIIGSGLYVIDLASNTQELTLDVVVNGVPTVFASIGAVPLNPEFPWQIEIDVFAEVFPPCLYDGLHIVAETHFGPPFIRGDGNEDGAIDISDAIRILQFVFPPSIGGPPQCLDSMDTNDDGLINIADPISVIEYLFVSGSPPPSPFPDCGIDPTLDLLLCELVPTCP
jgi:hypothetical protein